jgi:hexosaminidase
MKTSGTNLSTLNILLKKENSIWNNKRLLLVLLFLPLLILSCKATYQTTSNLGQQTIIPQPLHQEFSEGRFSISSTTNINGDAHLKEVGVYLAQNLHTITGHEFSFIPGSGQGKGNTILLLIDTSISNAEGYKLSIKTDRIIISGKKEKGVFYGIQSLKQLFPFEKEKNNSITVRCMEIEDAPRFAWRGMMLDLSRHFIGMEEIKKLMDAMADHKLNRLHLHLSDNPAWRIEIKEYPKLTTIGAIGNQHDPNAPAQFLTEKQGRELAEYARKRFISIIPEVDMPGHSKAVARAYPEMDGGENTLNVASEKTAQFIDVVVNRLTDIFNTKYFHFGSDEVTKTNWMNLLETKAKMKELGFKEQRELEGWFDRRTAKSILDKNLVPVAWDETSDFGVDRRSIVQWWRCLQPEKLVEALDRGHQVIISPADYVYFDYPYNKEEFGARWEGMRNGGNSTELVYNWKPVPSTITNEARARVLGVEFCVWTEFIRSEKRLEYMIFPRISAFAEVAWSSEENRNWDEFQKKLERQEKRYELQGFNFRKTDITDKDRARIEPEGFNDM